MRPRVIPILLLDGRALYKTKRFSDPVYVGDPLNAVRIFNDKGVDELVILDIGVARRRGPPQLELIADIASQCFMPLTYGGGIQNADQVRRLIYAGVEKVAINTAAVEAPALVTAASSEVGSQSVVVSIDVRVSRDGYEVYTQGGSRRTRLDPLGYARRAVELGAGELLVTAIDRDGTMEGYDLELVRTLAPNVSVPLIAAGGARGLGDFQAATIAGASAVAAGALFVFNGPRRAVLISYPTDASLNGLWPTQANPDTI